MATAPKKTAAKKKPAAKKPVKKTSAAAKKAAAVKKVAKKPVVKKKAAPKKAPPKSRIEKLWDKVEKTVANRITTKTLKAGKYDTYRTDATGLLARKPFRMNVLADWQLSKKRIEKAMAYNAEICMAEGGWNNDPKWRNRVLLVGILAAHLRRDKMAANWLAEGVNLQAGKLIARSYTYGYTDRFRDWLKEHEEAITTAEGWARILKDQDRAQVLMYLVTFLHTLGSKDLTPALLSLFELKGHDGLVTILTERATKGGVAKRVFSDADVADSPETERANRILTNLGKRVLDNVAVPGKDPTAGQRVSYYHSPKSFERLVTAINAAGTADDVVAVANALEGMEYDSIFGTKVFMRPNDHQAIQNVHISAHTDEGITFDMDNSGFGLITESTVEMAAMDSASTCEMKRP